MNYTAVNTQSLKEILGNQCSPMPGAWYVVGPDVNGRLCHVATCKGEHEARQCAERMNRAGVITMKVVENDMWPRPPRAPRAVQE